MTHSVSFTAGFPVSLVSCEPLLVAFLATINTVPRDSAEALSTLAAAREITLGLLGALCAERGHQFAVGEDGRARCVRCEIAVSGVPDKVGG